MAPDAWLGAGGRFLSVGGKAEAADLDSGSGPVTSQLCHVAHNIAPPQASVSLSGKRPFIATVSGPRAGP